MASLEEHQAYHNYILGTCTTMTAVAGATLLTGDNQVLDEVTGDVLTKVTLAHINQFGNTETKDMLLHQCLKAMELFEQRSTNLDQVSDVEPIREIDTAS